MPGVAEVLAVELHQVGIASPSPGGVARTYPGLLHELVGLPPVKELVVATQSAKPSRMYEHTHNLGLERRAWW